jgi:hypothetical protein
MSRIKEVKDFQEYITDEKDFSYERYKNTGRLIDISQIQRVLSNTKKYYKRTNVSYTDEEKFGKRDASKYEKLYFELSKYDCDKMDEYSDISCSLQKYNNNLNDMIENVRPLTFNSNYELVNFLADDKKSGKTLVIKNTKGNFGQDYREAAVGKIINLLKQEIPNFVYTYGAIECNVAEKIFGDDISVCPNHYDLKEGNIYTISEYIPNSFTLEDLLLNQENIIDMLPYYLFHIFSLLNYANDSIGFVHYDLHTKNILIENLNELQDVVLYIDSELKTYKSYFKVYFIDFDFSRVVDNDTCIEYEYDNLYILNSYHNSNVFYDISRLLSNCYSITKNRKLKKYLDFVWSYYSTISLSKINKILNKNYFIIPQIYDDVDRVKPIDGLLKYMNVKGYEI